MDADMITALPELYLDDETAWLETMARLVAERRFEELDCENLSEYLTDMSKRDRREVYSRLVRLQAHWLKWQYQPGKRSKSWQRTILLHQRELRSLLESGTLRNHAVDVLSKSFRDARKEAAVETGFTPDQLPADPTMTVDELLEADVSGEPG